MPDYLNKQFFIPVTKQYKLLKHIPWHPPRTILDSEAGGNNWKDGDEKELIRRLGE
jgi:hypothetical protein